MPRLYAYATLACAGAVAVVAELSATNGSVDWETTATLDLDSTPATIALPPPGTVQEAGIEILVDGVAISADALVGSWEVNRSRREAIQGGSFTVALSEWGVSPLGDPYATLGSPTGLAEIEFWGVYRDDATGTVYRYPLLKKGVVDNVGRDSSPNGHTESYQVLDGMARWSRVPVTLILPPGHGLPTGRMVKKIFQQAGATAFDLDDGRRRYKELQLVDADPVAAAQEVCDIEGRMVRQDRHGNIVAPELDPSNPPAAAVVIDEEDILELASVSVVFPGDVVTEVTATGTEQVHTDSAVEACGIEVGPDIEVKTFRTFQVWEASFVQTGACTLTVNTPSTEPRHDLYTLTVTRQTKRCGVVVREESWSYAYFNPEAARYSWTSGTRACRNGVYLDADATEEGSEPAYVLKRDIWSLIGHTVKTYYYDAPNWWGPVGTAEWLHLLEGSPLGSETGLYLGSVTEVFGWYNPQTAAKAQPGSPTSFDELDFRDVFQQGAGLTVRDSQQTFQLTSRIVEVVQAADGFIEKTLLFTYGYAILPNGHTYQYSGGELSEEPDETIALLNLEDTSYIPTGDNVHKVIRVNSALDAAPVMEETTVAGAPPAAEYLPEYEPYDDDTFLDEEDATFGVQALAGETRPIKVKVSADDLLLTHLPRSVKTQYPYAEDEDELFGAAVRVIRESLIVGVQVTLAANFLLAEDVRVNLTHRPVGITAREMAIDAIAWSGGADQPTLTRLSLDLYPDG